MCKHAGGCRRSQVLDAVMAVHRLGEPGVYVPVTRAKGQGAGANHAWRELLELISLHTVLLGRGGVLS
jgi:hypothetical protein